MREILGFLNMTAFQFIMDCVLIITLFGSLIVLAVSKRQDRSEKFSVKKTRVEFRSEIDRRKQEEDEITQIFNETNADFDN